MTQTPQTPAGWYPEGGVERWWDGNAWSAHTRPLPGVVPPPVGAPAYGMPQGYGVVQPVVPQKSHLARNLLIVFGVLFLVFIGGCVAIVAVVDSTVDSTLNDDSVGGPNNPLGISPGAGFEVNGFKYADGWTLGADASGLMVVEGLKLTNDRGKTDQAFVTISVLMGDEVLAESTCTSGNRIPEGRTVTLTCASGDSLPSEYDEVTIQDVI